MGSVSFGLEHPAKNAKDNKAVMSIVRYLFLTYL